MTALVDVPMPDRIKALPRAANGYPVPYFVAWLSDGQRTRPGVGVPDFRIVDPEAFLQCVKRERCWICGGQLTKYRGFVLGPMCVVTRVTSEPASHQGCALYAMMVCPFLAHPNRRRNDRPFASEVVPAAGDHSLDNPGVMALWVTTAAATPFDAERGQPGVLLNVSSPVNVTWWREGRPATRAEVEGALAVAEPKLRAVCAADGVSAKEFDTMLTVAQQYLPREARDGVKQREQSARP